MKPDLWSEVSSEFKPNSLDIKRVNSFFEKSGYSLPDKYIRLLMTQNGGYVERNTFRLSTGKVIDYIERISGIGGHQLDTAEDSQYYIKEWGLPSNLVLLSGDGHWWIALDYRKLNSDGEPTITYLEMDLNIDETIAHSFEDFINGLS